MQESDWRLIWLNCHIIFYLGNRDFEAWGKKVSRTNHHIVPAAHSSSVMSDALTSSRVWSCGTLQAGAEYVDAEAKRLEEEELELQREIEAQWFIPVPNKVIVKKSSKSCWTSDIYIQYVCACTCSTSSRIGINLMIALSKQSGRPGVFKNMESLWFSH